LVGKRLYMERGWSERFK